MLARRLVTTIALPLLLAAAAGCGSGGDPPTPPPGTVVMREYEFVPKRLSIKRGATLTVENEGKIAHNLTLVRGNDPLARPDELIGTDTFLGGQSERLRVDLKPGSYLMICSVPGHRQLGQYGTLEVR